MTTNKPTLDDILENHENLCENQKAACGDCRRLKDQIKALILDIVGEDEDTWGLLGQEWATANARRDLRQELRQKIGEL